MTLTWTTPHVFVAGETVTAATMNTYVSNNLAFLNAQVGCQVRLVAAAQTFTTAVQAVIKYDTVDYDPGSGYSAATGIYTIPTGGDGWWTLSCATLWASNAAGLRLLICNGVNSVQSMAATSDSLGRCTTTVTIRASAGGQFSMSGLQSSGGNLNLTNGGFGNYMTCLRVSA